MTDDDGSTDSVSHQITILGGPTGVMVNVSYMCTMVVSRVALDRAKRKYFCYVTITNISATEIGIPCHLVIDTITPATVTCANPDGATAGGKPYLDLSGLCGDGKLSPGESVPIRVYFNNPTYARFYIVCSVWGVALP